MPTHTADDPRPDPTMISPTPAAQQTHTCCMQAQRAATARPARLRACVPARHARPSRRLHTCVHVKRQVNRSKGALVGPRGMADIHSIVCFMLSMRSRLGSGFSPIRSGCCSVLDRWDRALRNEARRSVLARVYFLWYYLRSGGKHVI